MNTIDTNQEEPFVGPADVAKKYGVSRPTVIRWVRQGLFPAVHRGKVTRMRMSDVVAAMEKKGGHQ